MVYFIQAGEGGPIKIGFSVRVHVRLSKIRADNHEPVTLLGVMDGDQEVEAGLHARFRRRRGEWFEPTPDLLDFIATLNPLNMPGWRGKPQIDPATLFVWRRCRVRDSWFEVPYLWHLASPGRAVDDILSVPGALVRRAPDGKVRAVKPNDFRADAAE